MRVGWQTQRSFAAAGACVALAFAAGCASPGPPLPPSLHLPAIATGLTANRVGDQVVLHWTTPSRTTDKLPIRGHVDAEICRQAGAARVPAKLSPCLVAARVGVAPGPSEATDTLPDALRTGAPGVLHYRVQLLNSAGRTAGPSEAVSVASGAAPEMVEALRAASEKAGVVLQWTPVAGTSVELTRTTVASPPKPAEKEKKSSNAGLNLGPTEPAEVRLKAGDATDAGGTVDRTAETGYTYRYVAQRVVTARFAGQTLLLRSAPSVAVTVAVKDVFPPAPPAGLVAGPGFIGEGDKAAPTIDLSWEPDMEPRLAGYRVYRREGDGPWQRLGGDELVRTAAYRDSSVQPGRQYEYRVTAVSDVGVESAPSASVAETASAP
jgi:hypothetical protein